MEDHARGPVKNEHHLAKALHPSPRVLREAMGEVDGVNAKFAVLITRLVGTMWCAYVFAQTFLQLVLLSVIMVGQNVQSLASDERSERTYHDAEVILDRLNTRTQGGIKDILDRIDEIAPRVAGSASGAGKPSQDKV
jgi:hypothetical protein